MSTNRAGLRLLAESIAPAINLLFPPRCPACGEGIGQQTGLCATCWGKLVIPGDPCCKACQRPFGNARHGEGALCLPCLANPPLHDGISAGTLYTDTSRKLVLAFKHGGRIAMAPMLARLIAARLPPADKGRLIVPVPLHRWRLWQRGYNQAALLAQELAAAGHGEVKLDVLVRRKATRSLGGLGATARERLLAGAIVLADNSAPAISGRDIILVDDVLTSGATSRACIMALKNGGAASVRIACFARVLDEAIGGGQSSPPQ